MANEVCYVEFYTTDHGSSADFFGGIFGWKTTPMLNNYISWTAGESPIGGGISSEQVERSGPRTVAYIQVEDIEATLAKINEHGGKTILGKTKISDEYGYFAWFSEPGGAVAGIWCKT
jgi:hypothetical protein